MEQLNLYRRVLKLTVCLLLFCTTAFAQQQLVTINLKNGSMEELLESIENQTTYKFSYRNKLVNVKRDINISRTNISVSSLLNTVLPKRNLNFIIISKESIVISDNKAKPKVAVKAETIETIEITGIVADENNNPLQGAVVAVAGTTNAIATMPDGGYSIKTTTGASLSVSYIGYKTKLVKVGQKKVINIKLQTASILSEEVVVIGYGTMRKVDLTGSVGSVSGGDLADRKSTNVSNALQGSVSGVMVTRSATGTGGPGAASDIRVRGITTIGDSNPLIIVDGVSVTSIDHINPNDIETLTVLKDAASASIYGSRAAAGVILITTKRAKGESVSLTYSYEVGFDTPVDTYDMQNSVDYMLAYNELRWNDLGNKKGGNYATYSKDLINNYASLVQSNPNEYFETNWRDLIIKETAMRQSHNISISGGSKAVKSTVSLSYDNIDALIANDTYERITARTNNDFTINKYIGATLDINYNRRVLTDPTYNPLTHKMAMAPPIYGAMYTDGRLAFGKSGTNPYGTHLYGGEINAINSTVGGKGAINVTPIEGLKFSVVLAPQFINNKTKTFTKEVVAYDYDDPTVELGNLYAKETKLSEARTEALSITTQAYINYDKNFGKHNISAMVGYENYYYKYETLGASRGEYLLDNFPYLDQGPEALRGNSGSAFENAYRSYFGRVAYSYQNRYMMQANIRYDGSSRFHKDYRWGAFPSVSAGWVISEEEFMKSLDKITYLKLRASYGTLGNERVGNYPYQAIMKFGDEIFYQGNTVVSEKTAYHQHYAIQDISWETTESYNLGIDLYLLDSRLRFTGDFYMKNTKDMLLALEIPDYVGFDNPQQNTGIMKTKGFDLDISWSDSIEDFRYSVSANLSQFQSVMGDLGGTQFLGSKIREEGSHFDEWYGYKSAGLFQTQDEVDASATLNANTKPGDVKYVDISGPDGVPDGKITADYDRVLLGSSLPQFMYGGTIQLGYKGFDLSMVFQGVGKQNTQIAIAGKGTPSQLEYNTDAWGSFPEAIMTGYWSHYNTPEQNRAAKYPRLTETNKSSNNQMSDFWMFDGGYFRVKNITLSYTIPSKFTDKLLVKNVRVYASVNDLLCINNYPPGYDPEANRMGYPMTTSFIGGISLTF